ncbi:hypothetical protein [Microbacterium sp. NIBRBAC000506063]|uniref:hypothetical protein n=1 Tax=Microbacterium sp. NIBRBAC000506063 TaxID=2734618 RepID=UPI001BB68B30|nr:hypothetical protein [Microbacterium sp. NIBRBAC000506063]QTV79475.1 hypothetical protein KAE78_11265 [Microbacterium sp. NIBRBAC000506063]
MLAELVEDDEVTAEATAAATIGGGDLESFSAVELEQLRGLAGLDLGDLVGQFRDGVGDLHRFLPRFLGVIEGGVGLEDHSGAVLEEAPQDQHGEQRALAVLPCHQQQDRAESEHTARHVEQLERVDQQPLLPLQGARQQVEIVGVVVVGAILGELLEAIAHPVPELDDVEPKARLRGELTLRRGEQPRRLAAVDLTRAASPASGTW